jgi:xylose isomerase
MVDDGAIESARRTRYARWDGTLGREIMRSGASLAGLADHAIDVGLDPLPVSGRQEHLENEVNRIIWSVG